jgi:hypothetical protein
MKKTFRILAVVTLAVASLVSFGAMADAGKPEKTVYLDYNYQPSVKPKEIFLTADAGPYVKKIHWTNWGSNKTVGRGRFISDCASCGVKENRPAVFTLKNLTTCKGRGYKTYSFQKLHVIDKSRKRVETFPGTCPPKGF